MPAKIPIKILEKRERDFISSPDPHDHHGLVFSYQVAQFSDLASSPWSRP
jgi:hypothetical protein